jgi:hypothetical protein
VRGHGRAEVTATGPRSEIGKIGLEDGRVWEQWFWWADWGISRRSCIQRGTEGSNLASSSGESRANLSFGGDQARLDANAAFAENSPGTEWLKTLPLAPEDTGKQAEWQRPPSAD